MLSSMDKLDDDPARQDWIDDARKRCRCCGVCWPRPCDACLAGGVCDAVLCTCDELDPELASAYEQGGDA